MDSNDELLVLAHGVVTYSACLDMLLDYERVGGSVGYNHMGIIRNRLRRLAAEWWSTTHGDPVWHDHNLVAAITEASEWVIAHRVRVMELREQE